MARSVVFFLLLSNTIYASSSHVEPLTIEITQLVDSSCSDNYSETDVAIPGGCIEYQILLSNTSTETLRDLYIRGKIPQHTQLQQIPCSLAMIKHLKPLTTLFSKILKISLTLWK